MNKQPATSRFEGWVRAHHAAVYRTAYRLVQSAEDAQGVAQKRRLGFHRERSRTHGRGLEKLVHEQAGDCSSLGAIVSAWLPEAQAEFKLRRKQSALKAMNELRGASC